MHGEKNKQEKSPPRPFMLFIYVLLPSQTPKIESIILCVYTCIFWAVSLSLSRAQIDAAAPDICLYTPNITRNRRCQAPSPFTKKEKNALPPLFLPVYFPFFVSPLLYATRQALSLHFSSYRADRACVLKSLLLC